MDWHEITKDAIDNYWNNPDISPYWELNSFTIAANILEKIRLINDSIEINKL